MARLLSLAIHTTGFEEWVILEGEEGTLEIKNGIRLIPKDGEPQPLEFQRPEGYPGSKIDQLVGLVKGEYDTNYTSGINGIPYQLANQFDPPSRKTTRRATLD